MITIRLGPYTSEVGGASWRIAIRLKKMCSRPPCNHPAVRTVHHRPAPKTGSAPLSPKRKRLRGLGDRKLKERLKLIHSGYMASIRAYKAMQVPITNWVNPRSRPNRFNRGAKPHNPGFHRPQMKQ